MTKQTIPNEAFLSMPLEALTRQRATGKNPFDVKAPEGGILPGALTQGTLPAKTRLVRVASSFGPYNGNPYSPWWTTEAMFDRIVAHACTPQRPGKHTPPGAQTLFRNVQAVPEEYGDADVILTATLITEAACFKGPSRPVRRFKTGRLSSQAVIKPESVDRAFDASVPGVEQLYIAGISPDDYRASEGELRLLAALKKIGEPGEADLTPEARARRMYARLFGERGTARLSFKRYLRMRRRVIGV